MGTAANVKMGICDVVFDSVNLGYTKGGVKVSYSTDTTEKTVDNLDTPISEVISKQKFEIKVPLAEYSLANFAKIFPGATLITDPTTATKKNLILSGDAGVDLAATARVLTITPVGGTANDAITVFSAGPKPNIEFAYEKENVRVYEVTFAAFKNNGSWVAMGDITAAGISSVGTIVSGSHLGSATTIAYLRGSGFKTLQAGTGFAVNIVGAGTAAADVPCTVTVIDECTLSFPLPACAGATAGQDYDIEVVCTSPNVTLTLTDGFHCTA